MDNLPKTVNAGEEVEIQLAPFGDYPQNVDGREVVQHVTPEAVERMVANFDADVLVDADHNSETGKGTEALAWIKGLKLDPERGLVGVAKFTDTGADAISGSRYRFVSPAWTLNADGEPEKLVSVGFTNKPNLPVAPVLNMRAANAETTPTDKADEVVDNAADEETVETAEGTPAASEPNEEESSKMNDLKVILGLAEDATEEEIVAAVKALVDKIEADAVAKKEAEAAEFAAANADCVEDVEELKNEYLANPEATKKIVENCRKALAKVIANAKPVEVEAVPVVNVEKAETPVVVNSVADGLAKCHTPEERVAFLAKLH